MVQNIINTFALNQYTLKLNKMKNLKILVAALALIIVQSTFAQVSPQQQKEFGRWNLIKSDSLSPNTNSYYDSIGFKPGTNGNSMCTLYIKNMSSHCKHLRLDLRYLSGGDVFTKSIDVFVKPNGVVDKYYNYNTQKNEFFTFESNKMGQIRLTFVEDSNKCGSEK